ncbi:MAG: DUF559 domain-containing protein [Candidatus Nomurabacteria bacterium]|nr:MAG: DUF559 domain-containing protein [Candidatus Nomurabacteria bacterium]
MDGKIHESQVERDEERTLVLQEEYGLRVIRFTNDEVLYERGRLWRGFAQLTLAFAKAKSRSLSVERGCSEGCD